MKPRNREVNIFNMSVLDLLTGALGAFCFLTLALFPYYFKAQHAAAAPANPGKDKQEQLAAEHKQLEAELANIKTGTGLAPFTLVSVFTSGAGSSCAQIRVKKDQAPGALTSIKVLPTSQVRQGYYSAAMLFMFEPGTYQLTFEVSNAQPGCKLYITPMGKNASPQQSGVLTGGAQTMAPWSYTVNPDQLVLGSPIPG
ncbi:MAG: hypothetical protein WA740_10210 [Candidatus Binataceae bacterium]